MSFFRLKHWPFRDAYRAQLAKEFEAAKLTGIRFVSAEELVDEL
ncbi:MAG TPA: hypothetical protein VEB43_12190 [Anaeromyxobacter sp.]|nr:hypothetical protein [Anaeromyxobacter sp.]